jgi:hypothetical protein
VHITPRRRLGRSVDEPHAFDRVGRRPLRKTRWEIISSRAPSADCADFVVVPISRTNPKSLGRTSPKMSAQSKGLPKSHDSALATYAVNAGSEMCRHNRVSRYGQLLLVLRNRRTMRQPERPDCADLITRIPLPSRRSSRQVGTTTRSAQRRSCRCCGDADVGLRSRARWGLPCVSGRHNPDVITVLTLGHCRGRAVWRGPHQQSSRRRSRAGTSCRRGHRCPQGLDRPSHPCHRSRRRPRAP